MIDLNIVERIHNILIDKYGRSKGIRDLKTLESAIARPYATFDGKELYSNSIEKAAAVFESLIINHPFLDGNKRISYVIMRIFLLEEKQDISASEKEKYAFVISASKGDIKFEEIMEWLYDHLINNNPENTLGVP